MAATCVWILVFSFTCGLLTATAPVSGDDKCCPEGWTQYESRCFMFFYSSKTWIDAELSCIEIGGNLVSIHSYKEYQFIRDIVLRVTGVHRRVWLGGHDGVQEGVWQWTDGTAFDFNHWTQGEPNNFNGEHCLEMNWGGPMWNDYQCSSRLPYMCSIRPVLKTLTRY